tara:strand:+ start:156 stop:602 length:447 start_codon:yes stop_codon:yes gene_type:complete
MGHEVRGQPRREVIRDMGPNRKKKAPRKNEKLKSDEHSDLEVDSQGDLFQVNGGVFFSNREYNDDGFNEHEVRGMYSQVERASLYCADRRVHTYVHTDLGKRDFYVRIDEEGVVRNPPLVDGRHPSMRVNDIGLIAEKVVEYDPTVDD